MEEETLHIKGLGIDKYRDLLKDKDRLDWILLQTSQSRLGIDIKMGMEIKNERVATD